MVQYSGMTVGSNIKLVHPHWCLFVLKTRSTDKRLMFSPRLAKELDYKSNIVFLVSTTPQSRSETDMSECCQIKIRLSFGLFQAMFICEKVAMHFYGYILLHSQALPIPGGCATGQFTSLNVIFLL